MGNNDIRFDKDTDNIVEASKVKSFLVLDETTGLPGAAGFDLVINEAGKRVADAVKVTGDVLPTLGDANKRYSFTTDSVGRTLTYGGVSLVYGSNKQCSAFWDGVTKTWTKEDEVVLPKGADGKTAESWTAKNYTDKAQVFKDGITWELAEGQSASASDVPGVSAKWVKRVYTNIKPGKNKFNKLKVVDGFLGTSGTVQGSTSDSTYLTTTEIMPVEFGINYFGKASVRGMRRVAWFINGVFTADGYIDAEGNGVNLITPPNANVNGVKLTIWKADLETFQLEKGNNATSYESYGIEEIENTQLADKVVRAKVDNINIILPNKLNKSEIILVDGKNKFNKEDVVSGYLNSNGSIAGSGDNSTYVTTANIQPVVFGKSYSLSSSGKYARRVLWFVNGISTTEGFIDAEGSGVKLITPPNANVNGVKYSIWRTDLDDFQFEEGNTATAYEPFGKKIDSILGVKLNQEEVDPTENDKVDVFVSNSVFPKRMYAVVGKQFNLYYDAFNLRPEYAGGVPNFLFSVDCTIGQQDVRSFNFVPTSAQIGEYPLTFNYLDANGKVLEKLETILEVVATTSFGNGKNVLFVADSTWHNTTAPSLTLYEIIQAIGGSTINFFGKQRYPASSEARSGWSYSNFATGRKAWKVTFSGLNPNTDLNDLSGSSYYFGSTSNYIRLCHDWVINSDGTGYAVGYEITTFSPPTAFPATLTKNGSTGALPATLTINSTEVINNYSPFKDNNGVGNLNISYYIENILKKPAGTKLDLVCFDLGINDATSPSANIDTIIANAKLLINAFIAHNSSIKVVICLPKTRTSDYAPSDRKNNRWTLQKLRKAILLEFDYSESHPNLFVSSSSFGVDRFYGYPRVTYQSANPNSRLGSALASMTVTNNDVHPTNEGAQQQADGLAGLVVKLLR